MLSTCSTRVSDPSAPPHRSTRRVSPPLQAPRQTWRTSRFTEARPAVDGMRSSTFTRLDRSRDEPTHRAEPLNDYQPTVQTGCNAISGALAAAHVHHLHSIPHVTTVCRDHRRRAMRMGSARTAASWLQRPGSILDGHLEGLMINLGFVKSAALNARKSRRFRTSSHPTADAHRRLMVRIPRGTVLCGRGVELGCAYLFIYRWHIACAAARSCRSSSASSADNYSITT